MDSFEHEEVIETLRDRVAELEGDKHELEDRLHECKRENERIAFLLLDRTLKAERKDDD